MKLVNMKTSEITKKSGIYAINFKPGAISFSDDQDIVYTNLEEIKLECFVRSQKLCFSSNKFSIKTQVRDSPYKFNTLFSLKVLTENEIFNLLVSYEIEEFEKTQKDEIADLIIHLESVNLQNAIDRALDMRDYETFKKLTV